MRKASALAGVKRCESSVAKGWSASGPSAAMLCSGSDGAAADVEEDEGGDDEGVAGDFGVLDIFVEEGARVEAEVAAAGESEAADDQRDDAEKDEEAEDVGEEVVGCAERDWWRRWRMEGSLRLRRRG